MVVLLLEVGRNGNKTAGGVLILAMVSVSFSTVSLSKEVKGTVGAVGQGSVIVCAFFKKAL